MRCPAALCSHLTNACRLEQRAAVVAATQIKLHDGELLQLIHSHLLSQGLVDTAAQLVSESKVRPLPPSSSGPSLKVIATQYVREQHTRCRRPLSVLPPVSLLAPHRCPEQSAMEAPDKSIVRRLWVREAGVPAIATSPFAISHTKMARRYAFSRLRPVRPELFPATSLINQLTFGRGGYLCADTNFSVRVRHG